MRPGRVLEAGVVMERKILQGIKARAERRDRLSAAAASN